jgi:hypothetical protein
MLESNVKRPRISSLPTLNFTEFFCEFFEPLIHQAVFLRNIYPGDLFQKVVVFGDIPVFKCVHSLLSNYISNAVASTRPWMEVLFLFVFGK